MREFTESLLETASQESGHQVPDSTERPRRINVSVLGHHQPEWLAGVLRRLQTMEASIAALSEAAVRVAITLPTSLGATARTRGGTSCMDGRTAYNLAARTQETCCQTCSMAQLGTTGGLSIVPVKEIFTSQARPMDQLTG